MNQRLRFSSDVPVLTQHHRVELRVNYSVSFVPRVLFLLIPTGGFKSLFSPPFSTNSLGLGKESKDRENMEHGNIINVHVRERLGETDPVNEMHKSVSLICRGNFFLEVYLSEAMKQFSSPTPGEQVWNLRGQNIPVKIHQLN